MVRSFVYAYIISTIITAHQPQGEGGGGNWTALGPGHTREEWSQRSLHAQVAVSIYNLSSASFRSPGWVIDPVGIRTLKGVVEKRGVIDCLSPR